jgi:integrase
MANLVNRLNARSVKTIEAAGLHADGGGLYLSVSGGSRRWVFVYKRSGRRREMGLGSLRDVCLASARDAAEAARGLLASGVDPIDTRLAARSAETAAKSAAAAAAITFGTFSEDYIKSVEDGWRNAIHRQQWRNSLRDHAASLTDKPISAIDTDDVLSVLQPIWLTKAETAGRVRGRIEKILNAAKARGLRSREAANPAQWRGHLDVLLPKRARLARGHHPAMPYEQIPRFMKDLATRSGNSARALEFLILTAARSGEVFGARWSEIDGSLWTVPADRMKSGVSHTVTLSSTARAVLEGQTPGKPDALIFAGAKPGSQLSAMAFAMALRRMGVGHFTAHGFRSAFKDWAADTTDYPDELSEEALAHTVGSAVRRAYRRGSALERRMRLMEDWGCFVHNTYTNKTSFNR